MNEPRNTEKLIKEIIAKKVSELDLDNFSKNFPNSLLNKKAKLFLFQLIKSIRSRSALEIGTYLAGTTKIISEALGKDGFILTIEANKNRNEFIKKEISTWEKEFQKNTMPVISTSNDFFNITKFNEKLWFDIIFIDGDHTYTGALTDLINSSRFASPGGIIIVDDAVQPPVFNAVKDFLYLNRDWTEVGRVFEEKNQNYIKPKPSFNSIPFLILKGPDSQNIGQKNYSVFREFKNTLNGLNIKLSKPASKGELHTRFLISHLQGGKDGGMAIIDETTQINNGELEIDVTLKEKFLSDNNDSIKVDIHLFFDCKENQNNKLFLLQPPELIK
tara:strand:+ start:3012 stop:4004 length:993 start_codon:yes stop_codon:yes gene_type:complete